MLRLIKTFFWSCSGANVRLLKTEDCENERSKYMGIGASVLSVGILAGLASGYAFFTVFDDPKLETDDNKSIILAAIFGFFWGLMIFNLDRFLVSTLKIPAPSKEASPAQKLKNSAEILFKRFLPRLLLGLVLAFVISKPLELRIFETEIKSEIKNIQAEVKKDNEKIVENNPAAEQGSNQITTLRTEVEKAKKEVEDARKEWQTLSKESEDEGATGSQGKRKPGAGPVWKVKNGLAENTKKKLDRLEAEDSPIQKEIAFKTQLINDIEKKIKEERIDSLSQANQSVDSLNGLATRLQALSRISAKDSVIYYTGWLIFTIILLLEISPIINKILAPYGSYERLVDDHEKKVALRSEEALLIGQENLTRLRESKEARRKALLDLQERLLDDVDIDTAGISQAEINNFRHEYVRQAIADLRKSQSFGRDANQMREK